MTTRRLQERMKDEQERMKDEIDTYVAGGASENLAAIMSRLFGPIGYSPPIKSIEERKKSASSALDFQYLAFDMLLLNDIQHAREYLNQAIALSQGNTSLEEVLANLSQVQEVINNTRDAFDRLRVEKYGGRVFDDYLR